MDGSRVWRIIIAILTSFSVGLHVFWVLFFFMSGFPGSVIFGDNILGIFWVFMCVMSVLGVIGVVTLFKKPGVGWPVVFIFNIITLLWPFLFYPGQSLLILFIPFIWGIPYSLAYTIIVIIYILYKVRGNVRNISKISEKQGPSPIGSPEDKA
jgi:hypothetical protein